MRTERTAHMQVELNLYRFDVRRAAIELEKAHGDRK
jgi:hypothetical protein